MNGQPVHLSATFVATKPGTNPPIRIEAPTDLTKSIGTFGSKQFEELKRRIKTLVEEEESALYFHQDSRNRYKFDESCLPSGGVYGLRKRRNDDEDRTKRVTASKLTPIKTSSEFERHLRSVSEITYIRGGR